ncbi:MAG TPA: type VI secretion system contractile sheath large subunit [Pirellulaceae bacterium]|nr:type VI secretion system contractile sheath large subunit [Pirellulaceae bacterium]
MSSGWSSASPGAAQTVTIEHAAPAGAPASASLRDDLWSLIAPTVAPAAPRGRETPSGAAPSSSAPQAGAAAPTGAAAAKAQTSQAAETDERDAERRAAIRSRWERFHDARNVGEALSAWLGEQHSRDARLVAQRLTRDIASIDRLLNDQLNAILHQPAFQQLEASWRGLKYLVDRVDAEGDAAIKVRVLNVTWREVERDLEKAAEFDQSQLFRKVYEEEFGTPGGVPFSAMLVDHEIRPRPAPGYAHDDMAVLKNFTQVAAAAFCPFITSTHPAMFGIDDFRGLEQRLDHAGTMERPDYLKWRAVRDMEDSRFLAMTMPRVLMRTPYEDDGSRDDQFPFHEDVTEPDGSQYLWGSSVYALGGVLIRAFADAGWLADIRGVQRDVEGGGLVTDLPVQSFATDVPGVAQKYSTDVCITDELERQLSEIGFMPLCACQDTGWSAFYSSTSLQKAKVYDRPAATMNARLSSMLQYMLCVSRFAHYIKVLGRDKVGSLTEASEVEEFLRSWISRYVTADPDAPPSVKARYPLREAQIEVRPHPGKPGAYQCVMHLMPHYELEELTASVRLTTELAPPRGL